MDVLQSDRVETAVLTDLAVDRAVEPTSDPAQEANRHIGLPTHFASLLLPILIIIVGVLVTGLVAREGLRAADNDASLNNEASLEALSHDIETRISLYSEALVGMKGIFEATGGITRGEFSEYIDATDIVGRLPGVQALEWAPLVQSDELGAFEQSVRSDQTLDPDGYPDFMVFPESTNDDMFVVDYVVPMAGNEAAFGFDLGSNPARRQAIEQARDTGLPVATEPIMLVQEDEEQAGFLLLLPVYGEAAPTTVDERRDTFLGVVLAVFRVGDLLEGVAGDDRVEFEVVDAGAVGELSTSEPVVLLGADAAAGSAMTAPYVAEIAGRTWEIFTFGGETGGGWTFRIVFPAVAGIVATFALAGAADLVVRGRARAEARAFELTAGLRSANIDIRRSNADLEKFAYMASHDLLTPARNVGNLVELLHHELPDDTNEEVAEYMDLLAGSSRRMQDIVQGLLEFSRIQSIDGDETLDTVDLDALLTELVPFLAVDQSVGDASITWSDLPQVAADRQLLVQVFENLISNAAKYRHPDRDLEVSITATKRSEDWLIAVADNGAGIDPRSHDRIFEMFVRGHVVDAHEGTGIGLALCRKIIERGRGKLWVESEPGVGSTFYLTIPAEPVESQTLWWNV